MIKKPLILFLAGWLLLFFCITCSTSNNNKKEESLRLEERLEIIRAEKDPEFIKRLSRVNETLDKIGSGEYTGYHACVVYPAHEECIAEENAICYLIENPNIALPLMMERLNNKELADESEVFTIYFVVFGNTKSAESIPYIADYLESNRSSIDGLLTLDCAIWAAKEITSLKLVDGNDAYNHRQSISNQLRQWFAEHKQQ